MWEWRVLKSNKAFQSSNSAKFKKVCFLVAVCIPLSDDKHQIVRDSSKNALASADIIVTQLLRYHMPLLYFVCNHLIFLFYELDRNKARPIFSGYKAVIRHIIEILTTGEFCTPQKKFSCIQFWQFFSDCNKWWENGTIGTKLTRKP